MKQFSLSWLPCIRRISSKSHTGQCLQISDDGGSNPLSGFSIVKADNMDAALEMAKECPHLEHGTIEVAEVKELKLQK